MHERYLFPVFVFLPLLAVNSRRFRVLTLLIAIGSFINLHGILTVGNYGTANVTGLPFGADFRSFGWVLLSVVLQTGGFVVVAWALRPISDAVVGPLRRLAGQGARPPEVDPYDLPPPAPVVPVPRADCAGARGAAAAGVAPVGPAPQPGGPLAAPRPERRAAPRARSGCPTGWTRSSS